MDKPGNCLIILDGELSEKLLKKIISINQPRDSFLILSADGASNTLYKVKIIPDYIIGDLDSITSKARKFYETKGVTFNKITEQEHNDFEKCIRFAYTIDCNNIYVVGYGGKRVDHTINNFSLLKKYKDKLNIKFIDNVFEIFFLKKNSVVRYKRNEIVSITALPKATGIITSGLKYALKNESLEFGGREGALNRTTTDTIKVRFKKGSLMIFKKHLGNLKF